MTHEYPKVNKTITEKYRKESAMKDTIQPDINLSLEKDNSNIQKKEYSLGYVPEPSQEPSLFEREMIALSNSSSTDVATATTISRPSMYDLRNVNGQNFITSVKDQAHCGSCVAFGVCAAVEGTLQVKNNNPNLNPDFSEAHLFYCLGGSRGRTCGNFIGDPPTEEPNGGWWPGGALDEFESTGVVDERCFPYQSPASPNDSTLSCSVCENWERRVTKIKSWTVLSVTDEMKSWISSGKGPLVAAFTVYQDFYNYFEANNSANAIYRKSSNPGKKRGGHVICVIGYSDEDQFWICKNSWTADWGSGGFFKIGYGEVGIDSYMWGVDI
jgi:C1A family cysteine protease